jgi:subtilisin-like proprotein convertase family protein
MDIPDNNSSGITSEIFVADSGTVTDLAVEVHITHTYISDLRVVLECPGGTAVALHDRAGGSADDIHQTYKVSACDGQSLTGSWKLRVTDHAGADIGTLDSWTLRINDSSSGGEIVETSTDTPIDIPDNYSSGITSEIPLSNAGTVASLEVEVNVTHTYIGDLRIKLECPSGTAAILHDRTGGSANDIHQTYQVTACTGQAMAGTWKLTVSDHYSRDTGTLDDWTLRIH